MMLRYRFQSVKHDRLEDGSANASDWSRRSGRDNETFGSGCPRVMEPSDDVIAPQKRTQNLVSLGAR